MSLTIEDIIHYKKDHLIINKWIKDIVNREYKYLVITGSCGVGKSTLAKLILQKCNIDINLIDSSNVNDISNILDNVVGKMSIQMMLSTGIKNNGIILDDLEEYYQTKNTRNSINRCYKNPTILVYNNNVSNNFINKLSNTSILHLEKPSIKKMIEIGTKYQNNNASLKKHAVNSKGDLNFFIQNVIMGIKKKVPEKENKVSALKLVGNLLKDKRNIFIRSSADNNLISLIMFSNINRVVQDDWKRYVYSSISYSDMFEKYISSNNEWSLRGHSIVFGCEVPILLSDNKPVEYTNVFSIATSQIVSRKIKKKIAIYTEYDPEELSNILSDITRPETYEKCKGLYLKDFTIQDLQKIIGLYHVIKINTKYKKLLKSLLV